MNARNLAPAILKIDDYEYSLARIEGSEGERAIDVSNLRAQTGHITLDEGLANTGTCRSAITFIDGEAGILRQRGIAIEELAANASFVETAYLLINGHLPNATELNRFSGLLTEHQLLHEDMKFHFEGFPPNAHPMAILSSMINATGCYEPNLLAPYDPQTFEVQAAQIMAKVRTIAAFAYRKSRGLPINYPKPELKYTANLLHMMFSLPHADYDLKPEIVRALDTIYVLHADHEQNCSTSTVKMIASARANLYASIAGGVCALWGPLHGGANQAVIEMLKQIRDSGDDGTKAIERAKDKNSGFRLMGFGHRIYKNFDPRARIIKAQADEVLSVLGVHDPLLDIAKKLEEAALHDEYFIQRKLYPNVDFYSGIILRAIGIPIEMFTVMFAIGRIPGWISNYKEIMDEGGARIWRPRQVYVGETQRPFVPPAER